MKENKIEDKYSKNLKKGVDNVLTLCYHNINRYTQRTHKRHMEVMKMKKHDKWLAVSWWGYDSGIAILNQQQKTMKMSSQTAT